MFTVICLLFTEAVEMAGIEPASRNLFQNLSTDVVQLVFQLKSLNWTKSFQPFPDFNLGNWLRPASPISARRVFKCPSR